MHRILYLGFIDFLIQLIGFVFGYLLQTEKFYDVAGSVTFILLSQMSLNWNLKPNSRQTLVTTLATVWALRLGLFLFYRILLSGGDVRFDKVKTKPAIFLIYWMIQGLWVFITLFPVLLVNNKLAQKNLSMQDYIGLAIWVLGFAFEVISDYQKLTFKQDPNNVGKFIDSGLWSISRHPNYFGEITLWVGMFVIASSSFQGLEWLSIISPLFLYYLLNYVSGIPILERTGLKRYGELEAYQRYIKSVPVLVPFLGKP